MNQVLHTIAARRSHRQYTAEQLTQTQLDSILEAALQSPSAINAQPWHFTVVQNQELLGKINQAARTEALKREPAMRSPRFEDPAFHIFYHAPTVIFLSAQETPFSRIDCGIAVQNIALAAESLGLGSVILGLPHEAFAGDEKEALMQALRFPQGHGFIIAIAIGTPADQKEAHEQKPDRISYVL